MGNPEKRVAKTLEEIKILGVFNQAKPVARGQLAKEVVSQIPNDMPNGQQQDLERVQ